MLADTAAAAHGHAFSTQGKQDNCWCLASSMSSLMASSTSLNLIARRTPSRTWSAEPIGLPKSPDVVVQDGSSPPTDDHHGHDDVSLRSTSITGSGVASAKGRRSAAVSKTTFQLAHPPPAIKHRQRFNIRPKILLQLQQLSDATRPVPILDVLPSVVFAPRLARKFPSVFKGKDGLGADDLVVVNSQNYDAAKIPEGMSSNMSEDDSWDAREIVAAICQTKKRGPRGEVMTEICLKHGPCWQATMLPSGAYEFESTDEKGRRTVGRWVPRPPISRRRSYNDHENAKTPPSDQRRLTFSIINPDSRRHPVIATMSRSAIDISDRYSSTSSPAPPSAPSPTQPVSGAEVRHAHFDHNERAQAVMIETDEHLRSLIVVTGIWVAFREGYSPNFSYDKLTGSQSSSSSPSTHKPRSLSINLGSLGNGSAFDSPRSGKGHGTSAAGEKSPPISPSPVSPGAARNSGSSPTRAHTTGAAFLQRASNRRNHSSMNIIQSSSSLNGNGVENGSRPRRNSRPVIRSEPSARAADTDHPHEVEKDWLSNATTVPPPGMAQLPNGAVEPIGTVARKQGKFYKLFRFIRKTSGAH